MPRYRFVMRSSTGPEDLGGIVLDNDRTAIDFGNEVIRDLINDGAHPYLGWAMDITEGERAVVSIPFAKLMRAGLN